MERVLNRTAPLCRNLPVNLAICRDCERQGSSGRLMCENPRHCFQTILSARPGRVAEELFTQVGSKRIRVQAIGGE